MVICGGLGNTAAQQIQGKQTMKNGTGIFVAALAIAATGALAQDVVDPAEVAALSAQHPQWAK